MDAAPSPGFSLKDVKWSSVSIPLDLLVSTYRLPQVVKLDGGKWKRRGRRGRRQPGMPFGESFGCAWERWKGQEAEPSGEPLRGGGGSRRDPLLSLVRRRQRCLPPLERWPNSSSRPLVLLGRRAHWGKRARDQNMNGP